MKKSYHPYKFWIFSFISHTIFLWWLFLKIGPLLPDALEFSFTLLPLQKRSGLNNMCNVYSPKNLWNNVCLLLCVPVGTFWCFFNVFTAFCCFWYDFFITFFPHFYEQIKHKAGNRFYRPINNDKPIKTLKTKETQRIGQLLES